MEEERNGELAFHNSLLKRNNGEIFVLVYRKPTHTALTTKQVARKVPFPLCLMEHILLSQIKMTYTKKTLE